MEILRIIRSVQLCDLQHMHKACSHPRKDGPYEFHIQCSGDFFLFWSKHKSHNMRHKALKEHLSLYHTNQVFIQKMPTYLWFVEKGFFARINRITNPLALPFLFVSCWLLSEMICQRVPYGFADWIRIHTNTMSLQSWTIVGFIWSSAPPLTCKMLHLISCFVFSKICNIWK